MIDQEKLSQGIEFLAQRGLNLYAVLDCASLPGEVVQMMQEQDIPLTEYSRLVLLGHGGKQLWKAMAEVGWETDDPVDHYSLVTTKTFIDEYVGSPKYLMLYPMSYQIHLQKLGELAGWGRHISPLFIGISQEYGLWYAYRTAFLTALDLPLTEYPATESPCDSCHDKPCLSACPVGAVRAVDPFDIQKCADFRVMADSICQDRCLARLACPVAPEHRYELEQTQYHYRRSYETIKLYYQAK